MLFLPRASVYHHTEVSPCILRQRRRGSPIPGASTLTILNQVDLKIMAGESVAILGPSGSGKSTLLALVAGLDRPSSGQVLLDGRPIQDLSESALALLRRHQVGFVFQSVNLVPFLTAREHLLVVDELGRRQGRPARERADRLLGELGLADRDKNLPSQLS